MADPVAIQADHLTRYYADTPAVRDVSFELHRGDVLGFLGPNGAGKTTTMQMLSGNLAPTAGRIRINGIDLLEEPRRAKAQLGYLPEQPPLYRELTVDEYLGYCARLNRIPRRQRKTAVETAKQRCGLTHVGGRLIGNLSKGFQQRTGIAQAIIHTPPVVILDEPTVGLDPIQIRQIRDLIVELGREHAVILSTHILQEVQAVCSRVQIIHEGRLVFNRTMAELTEQTHTSSLLVGLRHPPDPDALATIPGVWAAESLGGGRLRVRHAPEEGVSEEIARRAAAQHWGLYELTPERRTLEQIFVELTLSEPETPAGEEAA